MKKTGFFLLFIGIQLFLVFFYINHQSMIIKFSYQKQKYEKKKLELAQKKQELKQALHASHDLSHIKNFALHSNMRKITLDQIKTVPNEHSTA